MANSTVKHTKFWTERKIDWEKDYFSTWNHPHRGLITAVLKQLNWHSLWEIGMGGGANLARIINEIPGKQLGGSDINADAVEFVSKKFKGGMFHIESGEDILMSDKSIDLMLSDMVLIYVDPLKIDKYIKEIKRVTRNHIVLCEFHSESLVKRLWARLTGMYHVYDYKKLLRKHGFHSVMVQPLREQDWPGADNNSQFRCLIVGSL